MWFSYKKYYFYKIYGTYVEALPPTIKFEGRADAVPPGGVETSQVVYQWTNVYTTPDTNLLSGTTYDPNIPPTWVPLLSTTGPNGVMSEVTSLINNTTYYTPYLVTQLMLFPSSRFDYGNLDASFSLQLDLNEKKTGLPGFDESLINWSP